MPTELRPRRAPDNRSEQVASSSKAPICLLLFGELLLIVGMIVAIAAAGTIANSPNAVPFVQDQPDYETYFNGLMP
jgi:hypothetical protein